MGKNNPLRDMTPQRRNYKLYKAKKQWFTACATFLVALGAMAATSTVQAAPQPTAGAPTTAVTSAAASSATSGEAKKPVNGGSAASPTNTGRATAADETERVTNHSAAARSAKAPTNSSAAMTNSAASFVLTQPETSSTAHSSTASQLHASSVASTSTAHSTATSSTAAKPTSSASKSSATTVAAASEAANTNSVAAMSSASSSATSSAESSAVASSTASLAVNRASLAHITSANASSGATSAEIAASLIRSHADHPEARSVETVTANYVDDHGNTTVETVSVPVNSAGSYSYTAVAPSGYMLVNRAQTTYSGSASDNPTLTIHLRKTEQRHYNVIEVLPDGTHKTLLSLTTTIVQRPDGSWGALDVRTDGSADSNSGAHNTYMNQNSLITATEPSGNNNQGRPYVTVNPTDASWYTFNPDSFSGETAQVSSAADYSQGIGFDHNAGDGFFFDLFGGDASVSNVLPSTNFIISYHADSSTHPDNNVSFVTYTFVDDNEGGAQVGDPVTVSGTSGETVNTGLAIPSNYQLASGQTAPGTVTLPASSSNITIHLTHKIEHLAIAKTETRTITVHYVNGKTGQPMGSLAPDAVIEAYYSCPGEKDLVTDTITLDRVPGTNECAYSWDSAAGDTATPGWHVISGDWGHKADNGGNGGNWIAGLSAADITPDRTILSVKVPDVPGYSAVTHGDWTWRSNASTTASGAPNTATSVIGADEFVWPGWGQPGEETYTPHGQFYEVLNEHTVYYLPNQDGQQTVTNHFTKWENGSAGSSAASDASINVYYENPVNPSSVGNYFGNPSYTGSFATHGSSSATDWTTSYGDHWRWATDAGSAATPGFATSDSRWSGLGSNAQPATGSYGTPLPVVSGYTAISTKVDGTSTNSYANPANRANIASLAFTQSSGATTWTAPAKNSTTYYVPDGDLTKTVTRTIYVTDPLTHATSSTSQAVTFRRTARVNNSDNAVVFGADVGSHFVSGDDVWTSVTDHNGTTRNTTGTTPTGDWAAVNIAKSGYTAFINGTATSSDTIADTPVTSDTHDTTVDVTYVQNVANITINHAAVSQAFTGSAVTIPSGITNNVSAAASGLTLPAGANSVVLDDDDYSWQRVNADGSTTDLSGAPTAVGTYRIILNSTGLGKFQRLSSNYTWNYDPTRSYVQYTITPATTTDTVSATLSGSAAMSYSGSSPTLTDLQSGTIKVTLAFPGATDADNTYTLHDGDYAWETTDGSAPTKVGHYTLQLTSAAAARIQAAINSAVGAGNVTFAATNLSGSAQFDINKAHATVSFNRGSQQAVSYTGQANQFDSSHFTPVIGTDNSQTISVPTTAHLSVSDGDFAFTKGDITTTTEPTELGTYTVKLTPHGMAKLEAGNDTSNYQWLNRASGTYIITRADHVTAVLGTVGDGQTVTYKAGAYQNSDINPANYTVTLSNGQHYTLQSGDLQFAPHQDPTNAGTYRVELSTAGQNHINAVDPTHYQYDFSSEATATFTIAKAQPIFSLTGDGTKVYDCNPVPSTYQPQLSINVAGHSGNLLESVDPTSSLTHELKNLQYANDYTFQVRTADGSWSTTATQPTNVGTYRVVLKPSAVTGFDSNNIDYSNVVTLLDNAAKPTYTITAATANAALSGSNARSYNGQSVSTADLNNGGDIQVTLSLTNNTTDRQTYTLHDGDYDWYQGTTRLSAAPSNVGTYTIQLNEAGINAIRSQLTNSEATNPWSAWVGNVQLGATSGSATFTIDQLNATVSLSGSASASYTGSAAAKPVNALRSAVAGASGMASGDSLNTSHLTDSDFDWEDTSGHSIAAPTDVGTYRLVLNTAGISQLETDNPNYTLSPATTNAFTYTIIRAKGQVSFSGSASDAFTGSAATDLPGRFTASLATNPTVTSLAATYPLRTGDLQFRLHGDTNSRDWTTTVPVLVGTYDVQLSPTGWTDLQNANNNANIQWNATAYAGSGIYTINAAQATATLEGANSKTFDGSQVTTSQLNATSTDPIRVEITVPGLAAGLTQSITYTLQDGDYTWNTPGGVAPSAVGNYTITLNQAAILSHLQDAIDTSTVANSSRTNPALNWANNVAIAVANIGGTASYDITATNANVAQSGSGSSTYNGQPAAVSLTNLTDSTNWSTTATGLNLNTLTSADFSWYRADAGGHAIGAALSGAPVNAGSYVIELNSAGQTALQAANTNYHLTVSGGYHYTINKANARISLTTANNQNATWNNNDVIGLDPASFVPTIIDTSNNVPISLPAGFTLPAADYTITPSDVREPQHYTVALKSAGISAIENAIASAQGSVNYNWSATGTGTLVVSKGNATISLTGSGSVAYTGDTAVIPYRSYAVRLSNGKTYTLQDGDLTFASTGNINVGTYQVKLTATGIQNIENAAASDPDHYNYNYDNSRGTLTVTPIDATATLSGSGSKVYDGSPADLSTGGYTVDLPNGLHYTLTTGDYYFANSDGTVMSSAPRNANSYATSYQVVLTAQGQRNIEALTAVAGTNNYKWHFTSNATFTISPAAMQLALTGNAWKDWDGQPASLSATASNVEGNRHSDISALSISWGDLGSTLPDGTDGRPINFTLTPDDLAVVDAAGHSVSAANYHNGTYSGPQYYIVLTDAALARIQALDPNYDFTVNASVNSPTSSAARYRLYARRSALTLNGNQDVIYGDPSSLTSLNLSSTRSGAFRVNFDNWATTHGSMPEITLSSGDLQIVDSDGHTWSGVGSDVPTNVGTYQVKMTPQLTDRLHHQFRDYDFELNNSSHEHNTATYTVLPRSIDVKITGSQAVYYRSDHSYAITPTSNYALNFTNAAPNDRESFANFTLEPSDLCFVHAPTNAGTYQIALSDTGIARLKAINPNYNWNSDILNARADYIVQQMPITITVGDSSPTSYQTVTYGQLPQIDYSHYNYSHYTITVQTAGGTTLAYTPRDGDLTFADGTPTNVGKYSVILSTQGLNNIERAYGTQNYTYSTTGQGNFVVKAAEGTITLSGAASQAYNAQPAQLHSADYVLTVHTANGNFDYTLTDGDLGFVDEHGNAINAPTNAGTYHVALTSAAVSAIEGLDGNHGLNYAWKPDYSKATYQITTAPGTATLTGTVSKTYDGTPLALNTGSTPVTVNVAYPGAARGATYTLQPGDYHFVGPDGEVYSEAPINVGTYTVELTDQGRDNIAKLGNALGAEGEVLDTNIDWTGTNAITGTGTYQIKAAPMTVTVPNYVQTETFDGSAKRVDYAQLVPTLNAGGAPVPTITDGTLFDGDYTIVDSDGHIVTNPTNAGTYRVYLNSAGLTALSHLSNNFSWPTTANGYGTLQINQASGDANLAGNNDKTYDGQAVTTAQLNNGGQVTVTVRIPHSSRTLTYTLADGDYQWVHDGHVIAAPTAAGTYTVRLTDHALTGLRNAIAADPAWHGNVTLTDASLTGNADFTIDPTVGTVALQGQNTMTYTGSPVTTAEVNSTTGDIQVTISVSGLTHQLTYTLHDGDYQWYSGTTPLRTAPSSVGTYTIRLSAGALANLRRAPSG